MAKENETKTMGMPEWHDLALRGLSIPLRLPINGVSMMPLIRRNRDMVTIVPLRAPVVRGDIVLFRDEYNGRNVLHRAWKVDGSRVMTWGDNCYHPDGWMPVENIWGIAVRIERGRFTFNCIGEQARRQGLLLANLHHAWLRKRAPFYRAASRLPLPVKRFIKKLLKRDSA